MVLTIVAATGRTGRLLVEQARAAGHDVTAVARHPSGFPVDVKVVATGLGREDLPTLSAAVSGADAVLSGLGPQRVKDAGIATSGTRTLIAAMAQQGVRRLVVISAAPVATVPSAGRPVVPRRDPGDGPVVSHLLTPLLTRLMRGVYPDLAGMEDLLRESDLAWTVLRPPRLTDGPLTGAYRTSTQANLRGGRSISRANLAHAMLAALRDPSSVGTYLRVAN